MRGPFTLLVSLLALLALSRAADPSHSKSNSHLISPEYATPEQMMTVLNRVKPAIIPHRDAPWTKPQTVKRLSHDDSDDAAFAELDSETQAKPHLIQPDYESESQMLKEQSTVKPAIIPNRHAPWAKPQTVRHLDAKSLSGANVVTAFAELDETMPTGGKAKSSEHLIVPDYESPEERAKEMSVVKPIVIPRQDRVVLARTESHNEEPIAHESRFAQVEYKDASSFAETFSETEGHEDRTSSEEHMMSPMYETPQSHMGEIVKPQMVPRRTAPWKAAQTVSSLQSVSPLSSPHYIDAPNSHGFSFAELAAKTEAVFALQNWLSHGAAPSLADPECVGVTELNKNTSFSLCCGPRRCQYNDGICCDQNSCCPAGTECLPLDPTGKDPGRKCKLAEKVDPLSKEGLAYQQAQEPGSYGAPAMSLKAWREQLQANKTAKEAETTKVKPKLSPTSDVQMDNTWMLLAKSSGKKSMTAWTTGMGTEKDDDYILSCSRFNYLGTGANVTIRITMGTVVDYFRASRHKTLCNMMVSSESHLWAPTTSSEWFTPSFTRSNGFIGGGSGDFYPRSASMRDPRKYLSFWGSSESPGGCCISSYAAAPTSWGQPYIIHVFIGDMDSKKEQAADETALDAQKLLKAAEEYLKQLEGRMDALKENAKQWKDFGVQLAEQLNNDIALVRQKIEYLKKLAIVAAKLHSDREVAKLQEQLALSTGQLMSAVVDKYQLLQTTAQDAFDRSLAHHRWRKYADKSEWEGEQQQDRWREHANQLRAEQMALARDRTTSTRDVLVNEIAKATVSYKQILDALTTIQDRVKTIKIQKEEVVTQLEANKVKARDAAVQNVKPFLDNLIKSTRETTQEMEAGVSSRRAATKERLQKMLVARVEREKLVNDLRTNLKKQTANAQKHLELMNQLLAAWKNGKPTAPKY